MGATVFRSTMRDGRRGLLGWGSGIVLLVGIMAGLWPSVRDVYDTELLEAYPEAMRELFDIDAMASGTGYLDVELFSIVLPAMFLLAAVGRGARAIAGEEQDGLLDVVLLGRPSRARVLAEKAAGLTAGVVALGGALWCSIAILGPIVDLDVDLVALTVGSAAMVLLGVLHGLLALAVGAATGRRTRALVVAGTVAVAGYVLHVVGALVDAVEPWRPLSPFTQAIVNGPISRDVPVGFASLAATSLAVTVVGAFRFARRDIGVG